MNNQNNGVQPFEDPKNLKFVYMNNDKVVLMELESKSRKRSVNQDCKDGPARKYPRVSDETSNGKSETELETSTSCVSNTDQNQDVDMIPDDLFLPPEAELELQNSVGELKELGDLLDEDFGMAPEVKEDDQEGFKSGNENVGTENATTRFEDLFSLRNIH